MTATLYLGTHMPHWLERAEVPLFVSRRTLLRRRSLPTARCEWVLDSGGFTELNLHGEWTITVTEYAAEVERYVQIGGLRWAAPMDWMCEPSVRERTRRSTLEHQRLTLENFAALRDLLGPLVAPVLQGWTVNDYHRHVDQYERAGWDLAREPVVGVGSVCRRNAAPEIRRVLWGLHETHGLRLHAFGIKGDALRSCAWFLESADSLAWSYQARREGLNRRRMFGQPTPSRGCSHASCANCLKYALAWRTRLLRSIHPTLWEAS